MTPSTPPRARNADKNRSVITSLLTMLPMMFSTVKNPEPALVPALTAAIEALEATGGKVVCSASALPTWGPGRLFLRDDGKQVGGEVDKKLLTTEHPSWIKLGERMAAAGVGVDFFLAAPSGGYLDVATIGKKPQAHVFEGPKLTGQATSRPPPAARPSTTPTSSAAATTPSSPRRSSTPSPVRRATRPL